MRDLNQITRETFNAVLQSVDARQAVRDAVEFDGNILKFADREFSLDRLSGIYPIAVGKASGSMVLGLRDKLGDLLNGGIISAPDLVADFPAGWQVFQGGHPVPNEASVHAAEAARELLTRVDSEETLIIFLISGGGSAMFELPSVGISLDDLRQTNQVLVSCGAAISEVNAVRRRLSLVKGGGLADFAQKSEKITLIVSDTNTDEPHNVASGLTIRADDDENKIKEIVRKYELSEKLPTNVLERFSLNDVRLDKFRSKSDYFVLLDNRNAIEAARNYLEAEGFAVAVTEDLVETDIVLGCSGLVKRLSELRILIGGEKPVALISGGEFVCPVRGNGIGGRSLESALRTAILFDELGKQAAFAQRKLSALFAGTDGIDGNSPAAGAICDETTNCRALAKNLSPQDYLRRSDSYKYFAELNDLIATGPTGTNVRDVRILLTA